MPAIHNMTTLQRNPSKVKADAKAKLVYVTGQGGESYVFASDEVFERVIARERADAAYEARLLEAVGRGVADIREGRFTTSIDDAFAHAERLRSAHA